MINFFRIVEYFYYLCLLYIISVVFPDAMRHALIYLFVKKNMCRIHNPAFLGSVLPVILAILLQGCSKAKDFVYIEDIQPNITMNVQDPRPIKLQVGDRLIINVHSRDKELVEMFNISSGSFGQGSTQSYYTVDDNGCIEMPIIGSVRVKGLTRMELQNTIRYKLLASKLLRDPIVNVEFVDMGYYVMGDMNAGKHEIKRDYITLIEAISECGDISITGRRDNILVLRTIDGQQTPYEVNITNTSDLYSSPVYYLQQNDIIYVRPTDQKIDQTSLYGSSWRTPTFWMGTFTSVLSLIMLFTK